METHTDLGSSQGRFSLVHVERCSECLHKKSPEDERMDEIFGGNV